MNSASDRADNRIGLKHRLHYAIVGAAFATICGFGPIFLVDRNFQLSHLHSLETYAIYVGIVTSFFSGLFGFFANSGKIEVKQQRCIVYGGMLFVFLYICTCYLLERIHLGVYAGELISVGFYRILGAVIFLVGIFLRLLSIFILGKRHSAFVSLQDNHSLCSSWPYSHLRHPSYLGVILCVIGLPMIFSDWLPLLAVPGVIVVINWRIADEEDFLLRHFGQDYIDYQKRTRKLIPGLY